MLARRVQPATRAPRHVDNAHDADLAPSSEPPPSGVRPVAGSDLRAGVRPAAGSDLRRGLSALRPELFGRALRMSRSPAMAEDLVQDTVERAIRFECNFQPGTNLRAWLHQILFSVFITRCRRSRRERNALDVLASDPCAWTTPEGASADVDTLSPGVARALDALPPSFRDVVVLVDIDELSYKDAASKLGVPVGTIMSRLHRGRRLLAEALRGERAGLVAAAA